MPWCRLGSVANGHAGPSSTYWYYLPAAPELLAVAADRLGQTLGELPRARSLCGH